MKKKLRMRGSFGSRMEVFVVVPRSRGSVFVFPRGSVVEDVLDRFVPQQNFYVTSNGRLAPGQAPLQDGGVYRLEPRLCGGKGGFGSMLRALGAQIEKTTNREACRDLSGRRLRDVNHEKEMAEWLKKQAEREAEKEQRRLERLQRKLAPPKHQFCDPEYQQQCHHLSERLEDSVLKGLQASSSAQAAADDITTVKRASSTAESEAPPQKKKKKAAAGGGASASFWTGLEDLEELQSSGDEEESLSSQAACRPVTTATEAEPSACRPVTMATEAEPTACRSSSADHVSGPAAEPAAEPDVVSPKEQRPPEAQESCHQSQQVDLSLVVSVQQLELLGPDVLKAELQRRGLKCGGTLQERAARLFSVRGLSPGQIDPALLAKPAKAKKK
ncbi:replication stress response regulator SDE2 [Oryzias melastigma]|uniref:replication stress response regulator SDE2 n=1 Tax=Oryzias melastigma TaxID=30732 RepID=UPI000CF7BD1F|nr:replication stress response regulator SDE2 [Oryzias melastigma]